MNNILIKIQCSKIYIFKETKFILKKDLTRKDFIVKNKKDGFIKSILYLLISQIFIKVVGLAYKLYLTNKNGFGDAGNAVYSCGFQIYALLLAFSSTGVPNAISKLVAERVALGDSKGAYRIFQISLITFASLGAIGTIALFFSAKKIANDWIQIPEAEISLISLAPSIFFVSIIAVFRGYFNGRQNFTITAKSQSMEQVFKTIFTIILVEIVTYMSRDNISIMAGAANFATTIATVLSYIVIFWHYKSKKTEINQEIQQTVNYKTTRVRKTIKEILTVAIPISLSTIIASINKNIDSLTVVRILKTIINENEAKAQYGMLSGKIDTLCSAALSFNVAFVTVFVPSIVKSETIGNTKQSNKKILLFIAITLAIGIPITIIMSVFPNKILEILFPNASSGAEYLRFSSISIIFMLLNQTINSILHALGKVGIPPLSAIIGVIFKFFCNILLISNRNFGIYGAIIGNIICNIVSFIISGVVLIRALYNQNRKNAKKESQRFNLIFELL